MIRGFSRCKLSLNLSAAPSLMTTISSRKIPIEKSVSANMFRVHSSLLAYLQLSLLLLADAVTVIKKNNRCSIQDAPGILGVQLKDSLKLFGPSQHYRIEGLQGAFNCAPIIPRDISLSDSQCNFLKSGCLLNINQLLQILIQQTFYSLLRFMIN